MQKSFAFIFSSIVQRRGTYSKQSSPSSSAKLRLPATQDVWLASPAVSKSATKSCDLNRSPAQCV